MFHTSHVPMKDEDVSWNLESSTFRTMMENTTNIYRPKSAEQLFSRNFFLIWGQTIPMVTVTLVTLVANGTVILMFIMTKSLRKCKNIYIASLAMADFFIGCTMPASMIESLDTRWSLRHSACKLHLTARYSLLYISMLSILLISIDRWWSVHYPFSYRVRQSRRLAAWAVTVIWVLSFGLHIPPIVLWDVFHGIKASPNPTCCDVPYKTNFSFTLTACLLEYVLPICTLWAMNGSVFFKISRRKSMKLRRSLSTSISTSRKHSSESDLNTTPTDERTELCANVAFRPETRRNSLMIKSHLRRHSMMNCMTSTRPQTLATHPRMNMKRRVSFDTLIGGNHRPCSRRPTMNILGPRSKFAFRKQSDEEVKDVFMKQDKKAAFSLGMLVFVFTLCWTPFMIARVVDAKCQVCFPPWIRLFSLWILLTNSAINPFMYGLFNAEFRKVLKQWFHCSRSRKYRLREALLYWNLQQWVDVDTSREISPNLSDIGDQYT